VKPDPAFQGRSHGKPRTRQFYVKAPAKIKYVTDGSEIPQTPVEGRSHVKPEPRQSPERGCPGSTSRKVGKVYLLHSREPRLHPGRETVITRERERERKRDRERDRYY